MKFRRMRRDDVTPAAERTARAVERASDALLDFFVLALAAWTIIYHVCLVLGAGTAWAVAAEGVALVPCAWFVRRHSRSAPPQRLSKEAAHRVRAARPLPSLAVAQVALAVVAAGLFAFTSAPWTVVWLLWAVAAGAAVLVTHRRPAGIGMPVPGPEAGAANGDERVWPGAVTAYVWGLGLAAFSLFLLRSSGDDAYYVHLSAWVSEHGEFPLRDTMFTNQLLPAVIYPPVSSYEALVGTVARVSGLRASSVTYLVVPFLATLLSVLAVWRLLRTWRVPMVALALSAAMVFLLMAASNPHSLGNLFVGRIWHGKIILLVVLFPLLWAFLTRHVEQPTRSGLLLLAAAGVTGVGLSSSGVFLVPVLAAGGMAALAVRAPRRALAGFAAAAGYPLAAGIAILAVGGRHAENYTEAGVVSSALAHDVLGKGVLAFVAVLALTAGPVLLPRVAVARMTAATVLLVILLYAPPVPRLVFRLTGLGPVQWRWIWVVPTAALIGAAAAALGARARVPATRTLPALALIAVLAVSGTAIWSAPGPQLVAAEPTLKRFPGTLAVARTILAETDPGEVVLAPGELNQTILVLSGSVTTVVPRPFYTRGLGRTAGRRGHAHERLTLASFAESGVGPVTGKLRRDVRLVTAPAVLRALRVVGVDLACVATKARSAVDVLRDADYTPVLKMNGVSCLRPPPAGS